MKVEENLCRVNILPMIKVRSKKLHSRISYSGHCEQKVSLFIWKMFSRVISISMSGGNNEVCFPAASCLAVNCVL